MIHVTKHLQVNSMAGSGCSNGIIGTHFFLFLFLSLHYFCAPQCRLSQSGGGGEGTGSPRYALSIRFMISQEQLAEFEYSKMGKISQVLGHLVILEPNSVTWGNGVIRLPSPGSWASGEGIIGPSPSQQHVTNFQ